VNGYVIIQPDTFPKENGTRAIRRVAAISATICALLSVSAQPVAAQDVRSGVEQLAVQITKEAPEGRQLRVAVADFPDLQGGTSDLGRYIASRLTTRLAQSPKFFVIERQRLGQVLAELKFGMSDVVDPSKAKQLGKMAGVEAIIVGTVADVGNQFDFDARMIDIETNRLLLGATVTIAKDPAVDEMNRRGRQESGASPTSPSATAQPPVGAVARTGRQLVVETLKTTARALVEGARDAASAQDWSGADSALKEYNLLVGRVAAGIDSDPFIQTLAEAKRQGTAAATALMAGVLARELEVYLTVFVPAKALRSTVASAGKFAEQAVKSQDWSLAEGTLDLYNLTVRKARTLFPQDPVVQTLGQATREGTAGATAGKAARLARELDALLAAYDRP
jgi:TolB-like protein